MWLLFGAAAGLTALLHLAWLGRGRDGRFWAYLSLSCTVLTFCALYGQAARWAAEGDLAALGDVLPSASRCCWVLSIGSVLLNSLSLQKKE